MKTELLVVVSDIQCGSDVGRAPPETKTRKGNVIGFGDNHHQEWLWDKWCEGISEVKAIVGKSSAALLVNGDATEGVHHRNEAALVAALIETHTDMAEQCLKPFTQICQKRYVTLGTECHTAHQEDILAEKIKAETSKSKNKWLLNIHGCLIDAAHHMPTTSRSYLESGALSIVMGNARINYMRTNQSVPSVFLRGHRHCGGYFSDGSGLIGVTGGFQFLTRHGFKVVTDSIPRPTMLVLDWRGKKDGALPGIHEVVFNPPQSTIAKI